MKQTQDGRGNGAFAAADIPKGTLIGVYEGDLLDEAAYWNRYPSGVVRLQTQRVATQPTKLLPRIPPLPHTIPLSISYGDWHATRVPKTSCNSGLLVQTFLLNASNSWLTSIPKWLGSQPKCSCLYCTPVTNWQLLPTPFLCTLYAAAAATAQAAMSLVHTCSRHHCNQGADSLRGSHHRHGHEWVQASFTYCKQHHVQQPFTLQPKNQVHAIQQALTCV